MRYAVAVVLALALVAAAPVGAAGTKGPTLRSLQAQIKSLQKQVKTLKKQASVDRNFALGSFVYSGCAWAVTADALQNTWTTVDTKLPATFGPQTPVNDYNACQGFQIVRAKTQSPPTASVLQAVLDIFKPGSAAARQMGVNLTRQGGYLFSQLFVLPR
jgi:hypothetical protein